jgi:hypothetical protein
MAKDSEKTSLEKVAEWAAAESGVTVDDAGGLQVEGNPPVSLQVSADDERVVLSYSETEDPATADRIAAARGALPKRSSPVEGSVTADDRSMTVNLSGTVYVDGMSRQGFITTLNEVIAAVDRLHAGAAPTEPAVDPTPAADDTVEEATAPSEDTAEVTRVMEETATTAESSLWAPTHQVPQGGLEARSEPDPALAPSAKLAARVELTIAERRGDWAKVVGSNGWTGWVDARRLVEAGASRPARAKTASSSASQAPLGLIGAVVTAIGALLPWFDIGSSINSFDISLTFLWDIDATGEPALGYLVIGLAVLAAAAALAPNVPGGLQRFAGVAAVGVAVVFVLQVMRGFDAGLGDIIEFLGLGVAATALGGVLTIFAPTRNG